MFVSKEKINTSRFFSYVSSWHDFIQAIFPTAVFFPKIEFFSCLHKNAFLTHLLALKHTFAVADKHPWILWFGNKVHKVSSPKFVHKSWQRTPKSVLLLGHTILFSNHTWQGQSVMFSLKRLLLNKTLPPLFMDWVHLLLFNIWSLVLLGAHLVDLRKKNGLVDHGATQLFHLRTSGLGIQHLNH